VEKSARKHRDGRFDLKNYRFFPVSSYIVVTCRVETQVSVTVQATISRHGHIQLRFSTV